jgi:ribonuclease Z
MKSCFVATALLAGAWWMTSVSTADAAPCLIVTLTGTQGGPQSYNGLAGAGTLVRYGDDANACAAVKLQFDAGRGTTMRRRDLRTLFNSAGHSTAGVRRSTLSAALMPSRLSASR